MEVKLSKSLWRNIIVDFQLLFVHHKLHEGPKVVAITSTTVKKFRDDYSINSTSTTRVYINLDIPEFNMFSQSDSAQSQEDEVREIPPQDFPHNTPEKRMVRNRTTLKHIMAMKWESNVQEMLFTICATINDIDYKFGWNYIGCENCLTKLTQQGQQYYCPSCDMTSKYPAPRFKIQLRVSDETSTTTFTMFDKETQKLLNTTATQLLEKLDNIERPSTLQNLCNRKLIFEIRLSDKNLKEGSQTYTANIFLDTTNSIHIKQEPKSPKPSTSNSKDKEDIKQKGKIHEEVDYRDEDNDKDNNDNQLSKGKIKVEQNNQNIQISSSDEDTIKTKITKKKKIMVENITSSDEEPILLRTLRGTKKKKPKEKQSGSVRKLIKQKKTKISGKN